MRCKVNNNNNDTDAAPSQQQQLYCIDRKKF